MLTLENSLEEEFQLYLFTTANSYLTCGFDQLPTGK